ncbi:TPA: exodeoxyribonuclease VII small subunit [Candidatus Bipolaricaulota bacterium]|nr:exodeoxyribonuclease VII small subunit [Candidatus Bipolaricaulota bacterium]
MAEGDGARSQAQDQNRNRSQSLEERLSRLEEIVQLLEREEVSLEKSLTLFEEGVRLAEALRRELEESRLRVKQILEGVELPFDWEDLI